LLKRRVFEGIAHLACVHYRLVLLSAVLLTVLSLLPPAFIGMRFAFDIGKMLPQEIPAARAFTRAVMDFDSVDEAVVVFHLDGTEPCLLQAGRVADRIVARLRDTPTMKNAFCRKFEADEVDYLRDVELPRRGLLLLDDADLDQVAAKLEPEAIRHSVQRTYRRVTSSMVADANAQKAVIQDVLGLYTIFRSWMQTQGLSGEESGRTAGYIADKNRRILLVVVQPRQPAQSVEYSRQVMDTIRTITAEEVAKEPRGAQENMVLESQTGIEFGGGYEIACRYKERVNETLVSTLITSLIGVILLFGYCFRRYGVLLYVGLPLLMVVSWTVGIGWLIFGQLNIVSCAFAAVLVGLGVDYAIHIYNRYAEERARGESVEEAFRESLAHTGWGVFLGMATTSMAFLALKATRFTQLSEFGVLAGLGIALSVPGMLFVLPALITWRSRQRQEHQRILRPSKFFLPTMACFIDRRRRLIVVLGGLAALACGAELFLRRDMDLRFDQRMSALRPQERAFEIGGEIARSFSNRNPNKLMLLAYGATETEAMERAAAQLQGCRAMKAEGLLVDYESVMRYLPSPSEQRRRLARLRSIDFRRAAQAFREALENAGFEAEAFRTNLDLLDQHAQLVESGSLLLPSSFVGTPVERWVKRLVSRRRHVYDIRYEKPPPEDFPLTLARPIESYVHNQPQILYEAGALLGREQFDALRGRVKRITVQAPGWCVKTNVYPPIQTGETNPTADLDINDGWIALAEEHLHLDHQTSAEKERASFLTGAGLLAHELAGVVKEDFWQVSLWVFGLAALVLVFFFHRHPVRVIYCLLPIVLGLLFLFGIMSFATLLAPAVRAGWAAVGVQSTFSGIQFNFINVLAIPIIIGLGVDNGIHLVNRFYEARRQIQPVVADTGRAIMITTLTSMVGFGSLAIGGYEGITSMGVLSILALGSNLVASLVIFPAVLSVLSPPAAAPADPEADQD